MFWIYAALILCAMAIIVSYACEYADEIEELVIEAKEMFNRKKDLA